jgi:hypothetical protein
MTLALPKVTTPGSLEITLRNPSDIMVPELECMGAHRQLVETPQFVQHIAWLTAAAR